MNRIHFTIMYHINTIQENTGTEQTLKGWMECVHVYFGRQGATKIWDVVT